MLLSVPIETRDLLLKSIDPSSAHGAYARWMRDPLVVRYLEVRFNPPDEDKLETYVAAMNASDHSLLLGMFLKAEPKGHIGNIKLGPIDRRHDSAAIGIAIGEREHWNKGLATQAITALTEYAFTALGLERAEAGCYVANEGVRRAFLKAGFTEEGRKRGSRRFEGSRIDEALLGRLRDRSPPR